MYLIGQLTLATALVLATTGLAVAQRVEITPSVGYRWGGAITLQGDRANDKVDFDGAVSWGATVDVTLHDNIQAEFLYSRQEDTALTLFGRRGQVTDLGNAAIDVYHGGVVFVLLDPENRIRPFFVLTAGATSISPEEGDRVTRFAGGAGVGVKAYFTDNIGLRAELRGYTVRFDLSETGLDCLGVPCPLGYFSQGDAHVGLIIGF